MKNHNPAGRKLHLASGWQRVFSVILPMAFLSLFAYLIWLALSGAYDHNVDAFTAWLDASWRDIRLLFH